MASALYHIMTDGTQSGPFTLAQIRSMWATGRITATSRFWTEGQANWLPILSLPLDLSPINQDSLPPSYSVSQAGYATAPTMHEPSHISPAQLELLQLQSQMKSKGVAAILAIFFPFFGCFYSAPLAAIACGALGIMFMLPMILQEFQHWEWWFFIGIAHVISVFRAILGVDRFNQQLIRKRQALQ